MSLVSLNFRRLLPAFRAGEWWEPKFAPILAMFYGTALFLGEPLFHLWPVMATVLLCLSASAAYVSVINDFTDRADDRRAGKQNRLGGHGRVAMSVVFALPLMVGAFFGWMWRDDPLLFALYFASWLAFSLYSIPPFRFKTRGLAGVLSDASGSQLFTTLLAAVLVFRAARAPVDWVWLGALGTWALAYGMRGILWHQLADREHDQTAGARTLAQRCAPQQIERCTKFGVFPLELAALATILTKAQHALPWCFLLLYGLAVVGRVRWSKMHASIVETRPRFFIVLQEFYEVLLPLAFLVASSMRHNIDWIVVGVHLLLFPRRARQVTLDGVALLHRAAWEVRQLLRAHHTV